MSEHIVPTRCTIQPNQCGFDAPLDVELHFDALTDIPSVHWKITFVADYAGKKQQIELGSTAEEHMVKGPNSMTFHVDSIDVRTVQRKVLANVGLLSVDVHAADRPDEPLARVRMVTQVSEDGTGKLVRSVFDPLG
jgi:hypothetical protein